MVGKLVCLKIVNVPDVKLFSILMAGGLLEHMMLLESHHPVPATRPVSTLI